jgi:Ca2+-binding EF-hand superfamily protein
MAHGDLKPENVMLKNESDDSPVLLADFGFARLEESIAAEEILGGTWSYWPPELIDHFNIGRAHTTKKSVPDRGSHLQRFSLQKVDMWALGVILYVILCGVHPFDPYHSSKAIVASRIRRGKYDEEELSKISPGAASLIRQLLRRDPESRPTATEVLADPWITENVSDREIYLARITRRRTVEKLRTLMKNTSRKFARQHLSHDSAELLQEMRASILAGMVCEVDADAFTTDATEKTGNSNDAHTNLASSERLSTSRNGGETFFEECTEVVRDPNHLSELRRAFALIDRRCRGAVDFDDIRAAALAAGRSEKEAANLAHNLMRAADTENKGLINFEEWAFLVAPNANRSQFAAHRLFDVLDSDNSGYLTVSQLKHVGNLFSRRDSFPAQGVQRMLEKVGADDVQASSSTSPTADLFEEHRPEDRIRVDFERFEKIFC